MSPHDGDEYGMSAEREQRERAPTTPTRLDELLDAVLEARVTAMQATREEEVASIAARKYVALEDRRRAVMAFVAKIEAERDEWKAQFEAEAKIATDLDLKLAARRESDGREPPTKYVYDTPGGNFLVMEHFAAGREPPEERVKQLEGALLRIQGRICDEPQTDALSHVAAIAHAALAGRREPPTLNEEAR